MCGSEENTRPKVLLLPWLAHGHITPFLELAKKLAERGFHCYICSTRVNLDSIERRISGYHRIEPVELRLRDSPELPPHYHTTNGLPLSLHKALSRAVKDSRPELRTLLETLAPDLLVHDVVIRWAAAVASKVGIESVAFHTSGAAMLSYFCHLGMRPGKEFPFPAIALTEYQRSMMFSYLKDAGDEAAEDPEDAAMRREDAVMLVNTSRAMEGKYVDYLSELLGTLEILPMGALVREEAASDSGGGGGGADAELMEWLDTKEEASTVLVSFGSEYFPKKEDLREIAHALEAAAASGGVNFIWIIRFPKGEELKVSEALPAGFLERVGERGRVVEKWAPQAEILGHRNTGGFVSHCGWNSLRESIEFLVPIIAVPMHLDQPMNAKLAAELGVGVEVGGVGEGVLRREEIKEAIEGVVLGGGGRGLRRRIGEVREEIRAKSGEEIDRVVEKLRERCGKVL